MASKPYYTSAELIEAVKRKISMPLTQISFTEQDVLNFANEEMFLSQIPSILQFHEEYLVYPQKIALVDGVTRYDLPNRAIGMKLRDLFYQDTNETLYPMANVGLSNADMYGGYGSGGNTPRAFYLESDEIVIVPKISGSTVGSLLAKYYLRPNSLVLNERAGICNGFVKLITVSNADILDGDTITLGGLILTAGIDFTIGVSDAATATNIATVISSNDNYNATANTGIISVVYMDINIDFSTTSIGLSISSLTGIQCVTIPDHFIDGMLIDFLQTSGGHKTYAFDVKVPTNGVSSNAVFFNDSDIPSKFLVGDYICEENECIIPQIPSDLHNLLAERTCMRILEAIGDVQGAQMTQAKIADLEQRQSVLINNRTEGSPRKVINRYSLLRSGKYGRRRY